MKRWLDHLEGPSGMTNGTAWMMLACFFNATAKDWDWAFWPRGLMLWAILLSHLALLVRWAARGKTV